MREVRCDHGGHRLVGEVGVREVCGMSDVVYLRFPHGREMQWTKNPPQVGEIISRGQARWIVVGEQYDADGAVSFRLAPAEQEDPNQQEADNEPLEIPLAGDEGNPWNVPILTARPVTDIA